MKRKIDYKSYDTVMYPTEWRYSAAIVGLIRYFRFLKERLNEPVEWEEDYQDEETGMYGVAYRQADLTEDRMLLFIEDYFADNMLHIQALRGMERDIQDEDTIKDVNDKLTGNTTLKKIFGKLRYNGENGAQIRQIIEENRTTIIRETYRNKKNLYANFANTNLLFTDRNRHCRLLGYTVDENRKSRSIAFQFSEYSFVSCDEQEFDLIPAAFTDTRDSIFLNCNDTIKHLCQVADKVKAVMESVRLAGESEETGQKDTSPRKNDRVRLLEFWKKAKVFLDYDVEVISKSREKEYFETLYIRKGVLDALGQIRNMNRFSYRYQMGPNYWIDVQKEVIDRALNGANLDDLIEILLKQSQKVQDRRYINWVLGGLIQLNPLWKESRNMTKAEKRKWMDAAIACGLKTAEVLKSRNAENKIRSYSQRLISAVVFHDYDRVNEILLQLSAYTGISYGFAYALIEDGEENKDITFSFIHAMLGSDETDKTAEDGAAL